MDLLVEMELLVSRWGNWALHGSCWKTFFPENSNPLSFNRESGVTPDLLVLLELPVPLAPLDLSDPLASKETEEKL